MSATTQDNVKFPDAGGNWQTFKTINDDGVHTLAVAAVPATSGGGGGSSAPSVALTSATITDDTETIAAGALAILIEGSDVTVDGEAITNVLSITAPEGYLLPAVEVVAVGEAITRVLRPA